jgi:hypothetical protein
MKKMLLGIPLFLLVGCYNENVQELIPYEPYVAEVDTSELQYAYSFEKVKVYTGPTYQLETPAQELLTDATYIKQVYGELSFIENEQDLADYLQQQLSAYDLRIGIHYNSTSAPAAVIEDVFENLMNGNDLISGILLGYEYGLEKIEGGYFIDINAMFTTNKIELATVNQQMDAYMLELNLDGLSDYEKTKKIYEFVIEKMDYVSTDLLKEHSIVGFVEGKGVCQAYAVAMNYLLERAGVPSRYIIGDIKADLVTDFTGHAWNMVKLEGQWYHLDATWDDDVEEWSYFLVSDEMMEQSRTWKKQYYEQAEQNYKM